LRSAMTILATRVVLAPSDESCAHLYCPMLILRISGLRSGFVQFPIFVRQVVDSLTQVGGAASGLRRAWSKLQSGSGNGLDDVHYAVS
jgi:hypothetical protein